MLVSKTQLPRHSSLYTAGKAAYHYTDSYSTIIEDPGDKLCAADAAKAFFSAAPLWVDKLFTFRNKLVSFFGLKTSGKAGNREELLQHFNCRPGEQLGLFRVWACNREEVILGEDDRHLDFRISLLLNKPHPRDNGKKELIISTSVLFHNWMGRLYFLPVKPFHKLIVPVMLKGIVRQLEKKAPK